MSPAEVKAAKDAELPLGRKVVPDYSPDTFNFLLEFDHRERYDVALVEDRLQMLNRLHAPRQGERLVQVSLRPVAARHVSLEELASEEEELLLEREGSDRGDLRKVNLDTGDINISLQVATVDAETGENRRLEYARKGRFEVKRHNDLASCLTHQTRFQSQLQRLSELPAHFQVVGGLFLYAPFELTETQRKSLRTIKANYSLRAGKKFVFCEELPDDHLIADAMFAVCREIANQDKPFVTEADLLDQPLKGETHAVDTPRDLLNLALRYVKRLGKFKALAIAKDHASIADFVDAIRTPSGQQRLLTHYTAEVCSANSGVQMKTGLSANKAREIMQMFGVQPDAAVAAPGSRKGKKRAEE